MRQALSQLALVVLLLFALVIFGCSKAKEPKESASNKAVTEQAKEAIEDYTQRPINKARRTQTLGDDRTEAMDAAVQNADKQ